MVKNTAYMVDVDILRTMRAFATLIRYLGAPDYMSDIRAVEYSFEVGRNYFQDSMLIRRARAEEKLLTFERTFHVSSKRWHHMPIQQVVF